MKSNNPESYKHQKALKIVGQSMQSIIQARIAQLAAYRLSTGEVPGSNPDKDENFPVKISN